MRQWVGFEYREFFDVPRSIVLALEDDRLLLLESSFSDERSEYSDDYHLYLLPCGVDLSGSWRRLSAAATCRLGAIPVAHIQFDATRRRLLDITPLRPFLP
jgi:hypothetical protein